jgi:hypothetical protein
LPHEDGKRDIAVLQACLICSLPKPAVTGKHGSLPMTKALAIFAAVSAVALCPQRAEATDKVVPKAAAKQGKATGTGVPSDNDVLRYVCGLIPASTPEMAGNRRRCMEGASMGKGRQRGVRPRSQR